MVEVTVFVSASWALFTRWSMEGVSGWGSEGGESSCEMRMRRETVAWHDVPDDRCKDWQVILEAAMEGCGAR